MYFYPFPCCPFFSVSFRGGTIPAFWNYTLTASMLASLVGLSLSYALPLTGLLNGLLTSSAESEQEMVALERITEYIGEPMDPRLYIISTRP